MGLIGRELGKIGGSLVGGLIGGKKGRKIGSQIGGAIGTEYPAFEKGGKVKKTGLALVHKDEFVLPKGVKPTKAQKNAVAKKHRGAGGKKPIGADIMFA